MNRSPFRFSGEKEHEAVDRVRMENFNKQWMKIIEERLSDGPTGV